MKIKNIAIGAIAVLCVSMFVAVSGISVTNVNAASNTYYYMPYFHTNQGNVVYCYLSNASNYAVTISVSVTSAATAPTTNVSTFTTTLGRGISQMISFSGQNITFGSETKDISTQTGGTGNSLTAYGLRLTLASTGSDLNCKNMTMACFQGTTSPKRNVLGYICEDDSTSGPGGNKNVLGF
ncbi:MAG: hypothetical protein HQK88_08995 [Nitrospirae bacterium]|nr:hypothetical protein [Nitrospirota bacterium]MBF0535632.1 hypothetical protein [Nitrospirota bacterium]MBF0616938.1 hypothetical protein [Nitrospirota bacterium]